MTILIGLERARAMEALYELYPPQEGVIFQAQQHIPHGFRYSAATAPAMPVAYRDHPKSVALWNDWLSELRKRHEGEGPFTVSPDPILLFVRDERRALALRADFKFENIHVFCHFQAPAIRARAVLVEKPYAGDVRRAQFEDWLDEGPRCRIRHPEFLVMVDG